VDVGGGVQLIRVNAQLLRHEGDAREGGLLLPLLPWRVLLLAPLLKFSVHVHPLHPCNPMYLSQILSH
jgi:hypothetical protein